MIENYEESKELLIKDIKSLGNFDGVSFEMRGKKYSAVELLTEIENETEIGMSLIQTHAREREMKNYVKLKSVTTTKRWWEFWK